MPLHDKDVAAVFPAFENQMVRAIHSEPQTIHAYHPPGALSAFATPLKSIHAFGYGARKIADGYDFNDTVLKAFVFDANAVEFSRESLPRNYQNVEVQVEYLPIQQALGQRDRIRPVVPGVSVSPLGVEYVGTLGCFLSQQGPNPKLLALSNNHVFAAVNSLPIGTPIVQPGPETGPTVASDVFAYLYSFIPIVFPTGTASVPNQFDAAVAEVKDPALVATGTMYGIPTYSPANVLLPQTGQRVAKMGRTTGLTTGTIVNPVVNGVKVNYGTTYAMRVAEFDNVIAIVGDQGQPFSLPGDSGSLVLDENSGGPVALLFAGDGTTTTCCNFSALCNQLAAWPI